MIAVLRGETSRLLGTRLPMIAVVTAALCGFVPVALLGLLGPANATAPLPDLDTAAGVTNALGLAGVLLFVPALIGTIAITSEYRHRTIGATFLAVPRRGRVLTAKLACYSALGLVYGLVTAFGAGSALYAAAALRGMPLGLSFAVVLALLARIAVSAMLYLIIGVAIGALARHQLVAVGIVLGYFYLLEPVLMIVPVVNGLYPFLPGGATAALTEFTLLADSIAGDGAFSAPGFLPPLVAAAVLLGYAAAAALTATTLPLRRDLR